MAQRQNLYESQKQITDQLTAIFGRRFERTRYVVHQLHKYQNLAHRLAYRKTILCRRHCL
ncbi:hypothetical protein CVS40_10496 [Lucilia cuprina]|nr:hypothetical protein CVS40_10496 [Lucilia cuprina]